jgi:hypothetical protein
MQKLLIILAAVLSLSSIGLGYVNRTNFLHEREAKIAALADRDATAKKLAERSAELKATQEKLATAEANATATALEMADLHTRLDRTNASLTDAQAQMTQKDTDLAQQKSDLAAKDARIAELEIKANPTAPGGAPQEDCKKQLAEKEIVNASLQAKLKTTETQLSEMRQNEGMRKAKIMKTGLEGKILAVNPSWNFVVISLGDRNGVMNNGELLIKRGDQLIGKVRITSVEPSTSIADIVVNSVRSGLSVMPGDSVIYNGPEGEANVKQ